MAQVSKRAFTSLFLLVTFSLLVSSAHSSSEVENKNQPQVPDATGDGKPVDSPPVDTNSAPNNVSNVQKPSAASGNCTDKNDTQCTDGTNWGITSLWSKVSQNRDMLLRTMYVLFGVTGVVIIYFVVRALRLRRKRNKSRKYGVISTHGDLEMEPLGQGDDEDEDYTVFEMNGRTK
ncbi:hypothetical protein BaRGS_00033620 [Batillaria attramentaria]|uniref:Membrane protein FAM174-like n=1 Tax=Batillaria attramentaria TaxID=370345 RepID=A0ABD0JK36_9CAEN